MYMIVACLRVRWRGCLWDAGVVDLREFSGNGADHGTPFGNACIGADVRSIEFVPDIRLSGKFVGIGGVVVLGRLLFCTFRYQSAEGSLEVRLRFGLAGIGRLAGGITEPTV